MTTHHRLRPKADANQSGIVKALRKLGYSVAPGHDDILVSIPGCTQNWWFEIKDPERTLNKDGRTKPSFYKESQMKLLRDWHGEYWFVWSLEEILEIINKRHGG